MKREMWLIVVVGLALLMGLAPMGFAATPALKLNKTVELAPGRVDLIGWRAVLITGCGRFENEPISLAQSVANLESRLLEDLRLRAFLERKLGRYVFGWKRLRWQRCSTTPTLDIARAQWATAQAGKITAEGPNPKAREISEAARLNIGSAAWQDGKFGKTCFAGSRRTQEALALLKQQQPVFEVAGARANAVPKGAMLARTADRQIAREIKHATRPSSLIQNGHGPNNQRFALFEFPVPTGIQGRTSQASRLKQAKKRKIDLLLRFG